MVRPSAPDPPQVANQLWEGFGGAYGWDVGANCGQTVLIMAQLFDRFTCFEPCSDSYAYASQLFGFADIRQVAVSDRDGELELAFPAAEQRETGQLVTIGTSGMEWDPGDWSAVERVTVPCRTADSLAAELGVPDFMKIDTEGHEQAVLCGAQGILKTGKTDFLIEFHSPENYKACRLELEGARYWTKTVRHPNYPPASVMWHQHGWIKAFAPHR